MGVLPKITKQIVKKSKNNFFWPIFDEKSVAIKKRSPLRFYGRTGNIFDATFFACIPQPF